MARPFAHPFSMRTMRGSGIPTDRMDSRGTIFPPRGRRSIGAVAGAWLGARLLAAALLPLECAREPAGAAPEPSPRNPGPVRSPAQPPGGSLLIVTLDTTRRDFMGFMGHAPSLTPRLDELSRE